MYNIPKSWILGDTVETNDTISVENAIYMCVNCEVDKIWRKNRRCLKTM